MNNYNIKETVFADGTKHYNVIKYEYRKNEIAFKMQIMNPTKKQQIVIERDYENQLNKIIKCETKIEIPSTVQSLEELKVYLKSREITAINNYELSI